MPTLPDSAYVAMSHANLEEPWLSKTLHLFSSKKREQVTGFGPQCLLFLARALVLELDAFLSFQAALIPIVPHGRL